MKREHPNILWLLVHGADALALAAAVYLIVIIAAVYFA